MRVFDLGDPGVPDQGILIGSGGGALLFYNDFVFQDNGSNSFLSYILAGENDPIPAIHGSALFQVER